MNGFSSDIFLLDWITPKTDWKIQPLDEYGRYNGDWFNVSDYQRITGNIMVLYEMSQQLYKPFSIVEMPIQSNQDFPFASIINNIENNIATIVSHTFSPPNYTGKKTWQPNGKTLTVHDLNRIESVTLSLYAFFTQQANNRRKLSFELNGSEF